MRSGTRGRADKKIKPALIARHLNLDPAKAKEVAQRGAVYEPKDGIQKIHRGTKLYS